jgi:hypothetical protein
LATPLLEASPVLKLEEGIVKYEFSSGCKGPKELAVNIHYQCRNAVYLFLFSNREDCNLMLCA